MKELKTLSAFVDEYRQTYKEYFESGKIVESLKVNAKNCLMAELGLKVFKAKETLDLPVTLSQFIPCKDGKPLKKPKQNTPVESAAYRMKMKDYKKACEAVLFEGWELVSNDTYDSGVRVIEIKNKDWQMQFYYGGSYEGQVALTQDVTRPLPEDTNPLIHDLAEATKDNPLKMRQ